MKLVKSLLIVLGLISFISTGFAASDGSKTEHKHHARHSQSKHKADHGKVNLNKATAEQLTELKGIGTKKAEAIVAYRKQHGRFKSIDDLTKVKGVSQRIVNMVKKQLTL